MTTQKMLSELRKTINVFGMIKDGDRIAVGLSGGKDSLAMLYLLHRYAMFSPQRYSLVAITIDMGLGSDFSGLTSFCKSINTEHVIVATEIGKIVFDERKEKNPCSLCANMRRGALVNSASELKCNKLALGHNADDLIETFFLSMSFEGRLSALPPVTYLEDKNISIIRPLILTFEKNVAAYATFSYPQKSLSRRSSHQSGEHKKTAFCRRQRRSVFKTAYFVGNRFTRQVQFVR